MLVVAQASPMRVLRFRSRWCGRCVRGRRTCILLRGHRAVLLYRRRRTSSSHGGELCPVAGGRRSADSDGEIRAGDGGPRRGRAQIRPAANGSRRRGRSHPGRARPADPSTSGLVCAAEHARRRDTGVQHRRAGGVCECAQLPWRARRRPWHPARRDARERGGAGATGLAGEREGALAPTSVERQSGRRRPRGRPAAVGAVRAGGTIALTAWLRKTPSDRCSSRSSRR